MSIPFIPDSLQKLIIFIGVTILGFSSFQVVTNFEKVNSLNDNIQELNDSITKYGKIQSFNAFEFGEKVILILRGFQIRNPISAANGDLVLNISPKDITKLGRLYDSAAQFYATYKSNEFENGLLIELTKAKIARLKNVIIRAKESILIYFYGICLGALLALVWITMQALHQKTQDELIYRQLGQTPKFYQYCQSCAKEFTSMVTPGKEIDGTINKAFCNQCYSNGDFTENIPWDDYLRAKFIELRAYPRQARRIILRRLVRSDRWRFPYKDSDTYK